MQLQHELHHELPAHTLELLFRGQLVESSNRVCLDLASKHVALPTRIPILERVPPQSNSVHFSMKDSM